ncbi:hypothetical protein ACFLTL_01510 [Chloroflexota bacterium]
MSGKAESRLIYNSISTSERVASLGIKGALLYTWLITHCDTQGRIPGKPRVIKHQVVPFIDEITVDDVAEALESMESDKLITLYEDSKGRSLIQIADWWDWQKGLRYSSPSHYEAPPGWEDRLTSRDEYGKFTKND